MDKKQESIVRLNKNLKRLLDMSGVDDATVEKVKSLNAVDVSGKVVRYASLENYLDVVCEQIKLVINALEDFEVNACSRVFELEDENTRLSAENESMRNEMAVSSNDVLLGIIKEIIGMRETLYTRIDWGDGKVSEEDDNMKLLNTQLKETAKILENAGVIIHDGADDFDSSMCTIVETVETDEDELVGKIVKVFRPGYEYDGEMLKSKEVIVYVKKVG